VQNKKLIKNASVLSLPGILAIFISLISIPVHLKIAGAENYGNYIIFHFLLTLGSLLNFGIGKSIVISMNNFPKKSKSVSYYGIKYSFFLCILIFILFIPIIFISDFGSNNLIFSSSTILNYFLIGILITLIYVSLEGILQGNEKFKSLSLYNFIFYSLSMSLPSISLIYFKDSTLENLIVLSVLIKLLTILMMFYVIIKNNHIKKDTNKILFNNLKKNAKWLTLNSILVQFYDLFDKYLVKIFIGPIALASYSIPQQLTGKLSILSKGFSAFLLPFLSKKQFSNNDFNTTIKIFLIFIPIIIFLFFPFFELFLKLWLGSQFNNNILDLTKIFSLSVIFSCASHILVTKFEATQTLKNNLKIEFYLMPFFLVLLFYLVLNSYSIFIIGNLILLKEFILLFFRLNLLKKSINNIKIYYIYSILFLSILFFSFYNQAIFYILVFLLILSLLKNDK
tara:strand:+ start:1311 stop:2669 length:1359 start_codon:yes stop_codon:yes gene_type:complete